MTRGGGADTCPGVKKLFMFGDHFRNCPERQQWRQMIECCRRAQGVGSRLPGVIAPLLVLSGVSHANRSHATTIPCLMWGPAY
jgi:hypothetical protein